MPGIGPSRGSLVLVTGGAGFVGAAVVRRLLAQGHRVRVLDDFSSGRRERLEGLDVDVVADDVRFERAARAGVDGAAAVIHLASAGRRGKAARQGRIAHDVNVTGTLNLCAAAAAAHVSKFVFTSSASVYGARVPYLLHEDCPTRPLSPEGAQKLAAETYVRLYAAEDALPACVLRLFSVYGPGQDGSAEDGGFVARFVALASNRRAITLHGDGSQARDLMHVEDVAAAIVATLTTPAATGRTLNVASGEAVAVRHVAATLSELVGGLPPPRYAPAREEDLQDVRASIAAATAVLDLRPRVKLRDGLAECLAATRLGRARSGSVVSPVPLFAERPPSWEMPEDPLVSWPELDPGEGARP